MPKHAASRRAVLAGAAGVVATGALTAAPVLADVSVSDDLIEIRRVAQILWAALSATADMQIGSPEYEAATIEQHRMHDEWRALAERIWSKPVLTLIDLLERAEIAWVSSSAAFRPLEELTEGMTGYMDEDANAQLLFAVLKMGGAHA